MRSRRWSRLLIQLGTMVFFGLSAWLGGAVGFQETDDEERQIFEVDFLNARARARTPQTKATGRPGIASDLLGITLWRMRPAGSGDDTQARLLDHEGDSETALVGERVSSETKFKEGQKVRLSIESARNGYLYVIDREQYADGTFSDPYLIFPTLRINNGDNAVTAGRLVELPDQNDRPFYFKMKRSRTDQIGEVLTMFVTSKPISDLQLTRRPLKLTPQQFAEWEQASKAPTKRVEVVKLAGTTYTRAEMSAGARSTTVLARQDPPPQTIYRISAKPGDPVLITLTLRYDEKK